MVLCESNSRVCFLCHNVMVTPKTKLLDWELIWLQQCSESLSQLLQVEQFNSAFFESGSYCAECMTLAREVDFTIRTVTSMEKRLSKFRAKIAELLLAEIDTDDTEENTGDNLKVMSFQDLSAPIPSFILLDPDDYNLDTGHDKLKIMSTSPPRLQNQVKVSKEPSPPKIPIDTQYQTSRSTPSSIQKRTDDQSKTFNVTAVKIKLAKPHLALPRNNLKRSVPGNDTLVTSSNCNILKIVDNSKVGIKEVTIEERDDHHSGAEVSSPPRVKKRPRPMPTKSSRIKSIYNYRYKMPKIIGSQPQVSDSKTTLPSEEVAGFDTDVDYDKMPATVLTRQPEFSKMTEVEFLTKMKKGDDIWRRTDEELEGIIKEFVETVLECQHSQIEGQLEGQIQDSQGQIEGESRQALLVHLLRCEMEEYHNTAKTYVCTHSGCRARFYRIQRVRVHIEREHGEYLDSTPFQCFLCPLRCKSDKGLDAHVRQVHEGDLRPHHCEVPGCGKTFPQSSYLNHHIRLTHKEIHVPYMGDKAFYHKYRDKNAMTSKAYLQTNTNRSKTRRTHSCLVEGCHYKGYSNDSVTIHHLEVHATLARPFHCKLCGQDFRIKGNYRRHSCLMKEKAGHQCEHCGKIYTKHSSNLFHLSEHIRDVHPETLQFMCSICHRTYGRQQDLDWHERRHNPVTGYNCILYGCSSPNFDTLEKLRAHCTGPFHDMSLKMEVCAVCGFITKGPAAMALMRAHLSIHPGELPLKCRCCEEGFKTYSERTRHEESNHSNLINKRIPRPGYQKVSNIKN